MNRSLTLIGSMTLLGAVAVWRDFRFPAATNDSPVASSVGFAASAANPQGADTFESHFAAESAPEAEGPPRLEPELPSTATTADAAAEEQYANPYLSLMEQNRLFKSEHSKEQFAAVRAHNFAKYRQLATRLATDGRNSTGISPELATKTPQTGVYAELREQITSGKVSHSDREANRFAGFQSYESQSEPLR